MARSKISTFDDWIDYFRQWQKDIGYDSGLLGDYKFETKLGEIHTPEIEFGDFRGQPKWQRVEQMPNQSIRDALLNLIVYQGDTEFASVEQQKNLLDNAPTDYDRQSLIRVNSEEMRHGWQMCYLLVTYFGDSGRLEAQKLLERRAFNGNRLLGSFNAPVNNWLDFFTYTQFVDRDGKFQLTMLSHSGFAPLAESVTYMLKEESFHMFTGNTGLTRIVRARKIEVVAADGSHTRLLFHDARGSSERARGEQVVRGEDHAVIRIRPAEQSFVVGGDVSTIGRVPPVGDAGVLGTQCAADVRRVVR